jgi:ferredoxin-nitrite reductase
VSTLFNVAQTPAEVVQAIEAHGPCRWTDLAEADRALGISKLRLAGVYDDRQDGYFMLRTRIPGGRITASQLDVVAGVARDFAHRPPDEEGPDRFVEITTRQGLQIHWLRFESLPEIWRRFQAVGLTSQRSAGDTLRNIASCPVDGIDSEAVLDADEVLTGLDDLVHEQPRLTAFLPRKFKVAVTGCRTDCISARLHDLAFTPARFDGTPGFNVHAGGGLSDSPRLASLLDLFVRPDQVPAVVHAALDLYAERGDRQHKAVNRFRFLIHEIGPQAATQEIRRRLPFRADSAGADMSTWQPADHLGVNRDRFGRCYVGLCVPVGRLTAADLAEVARLAHGYGDGGIRLTQRQNLLLTGVTDAEGLLAEPILERLPAVPDPFVRAVLACTSAPFCKFGILNVKEYGTELIDHLRHRVPVRAWPRLDGLRIHLSGCKASCAQVQAAHIGLRGTIVSDENAHRDAFDIAVDGDVGQGRLGRWAALDVAQPRAFTAVEHALMEVAEAGKGPGAIAEAMTPERIEEAGTVRGGVR